MLTERKVFFQNSTKDRMAHFNISIAIKHRRDKNLKDVLTVERKQQWFLKRTQRSLNLLDAFYFTLIIKNSNNKTFKYAIF